MKICKLSPYQKNELVEYLNEIQFDFEPPLFLRINERSNAGSIENYAEKLLDKANVFACKNDFGKEIIALIAIYTNDLVKYEAYIPILSVSKSVTGKGIATRLVNYSIQTARENKMKFVNVKTWRSNYKAIELYTKLKFTIKTQDDFNVLFELKL